jgi:F5/8 type C domain
MKKLIFLVFLFSKIPVLGQTITSPSPLSIEANAINVDAGDFVVNWANSTDNILVSLSLDYQNSATFSLPVTTGLTLNTGYTSWTNITSIVFYGTKTNVNNALAAMTLSMGTVKTAVKISLEATLYDVNYVYNPTNKHFYRYISGNITYANAKTNAATYSFKGKTGYLATITSDSENNFINNNISGNNIWIAASDGGNEGTWKIDAGPESGTTFWQSTTLYNNTMTSMYTGGSTISGQYSSWCNGEPNNADGNNAGEDQAVAKWNGGTCWNDIAAANYSSIQGYIIEISSDFPAGSDYTNVFSTFTVHNNDIAFSLASSNASRLTSANTSNLPNVYGGIQVNSGHTYTLNSGKTLNTNKMIFNGTGKLVLTDAMSKWIPGISSTANTTIHSPSTNNTPSYWSVSSSYSSDAFYPNASYPSPTNSYHFTPWLNSPQGWSAATNDVNQYITLGTHMPAYITGIIIQGRQNSAQYVTKADIDVSLDGLTWKSVLTNAVCNSNITEGVTLLFPSVEYAKFVKVKPKEWSGHITMRMGLLLKNMDIVSDGLVLQLDPTHPVSYKGTGTQWSDLSGQNNHATLVSSPSYSSQERGYFILNGSSNYFSGNAISATSGNNSRTVSMWYKSSANQTIPLLDKGAITDNTAEQLFVVYTNSVTTAPPTSPGGIVICFWGNDLYFPLGSSTVFDGKWHNITYTYDSSNTSVSFCFDGIFSTTSYYWSGGSWTTKSTNPITLSSSLNTSNNPFYIGYTRAKFWGFGSLYANTNIGQTLIYNRALTNSEILTNYYASKSIYGK